jgi:prepilin-type N-terminal cleavage/methylation domain-containing protein
MVKLLMKNRLPNPARSQGFTLIEIMVSITILAVGVLALGGLLVRASQTAEAASAVSYQTTAIMAEMNRYNALPFAQLAAGTTCTTVTTPPLPHALCIIITNVSANVRLVTIRVTPSGSPALPADSVMFERSITGNSTPLGS